MNGSAGGVCGIALGSNLGDRLSCLRGGVLRLLSLLPGARVLAVAPVYETAPVDCGADAGAFYNTVIELESPVGPLALRRLTAEVELALGRPEERELNAPRPLDLDLLYFDAMVMEGSELVLPHPRLHERRFVLQPLAQIRPKLVLPGFQKSVSELLAALKDDPATVRGVAEGDWVEVRYKVPLRAWCDRSGGT